jgi:predicted ribosome quality control (RQC) complex YloA/Tae2 family protein
VKYYLLKAITEYLKQNCDFIKYIRRIQNNTIIIEFNNKNIIYFDLSKGNSSIFKSKEQILAKRDFNAPFDVVLQKRFINAKIEDIYLHNDDKILRIQTINQSSYKKITTTLQLEFTGKYTNIIILDESDIVLEALRHIDEDSSSRVVRVGHKLDELAKIDIVFKMEKIDCVETILYDVFENKEKKSLEDIKKQKIISLEKKQKDLEKTIENLPKKEELEKESEDFYLKANLLLSSLHEIKPYQKSFVTVDYEGNGIEIDLKNASNINIFVDELFTKAKRAKQKSINIKIEKINLEEKLEFIKRLIVNLEQAKTIDECEFLLPKKDRNQTKTKKSKNYESFYFEGFKIMLGSNERENIYLLENSKASDFWFHLKDRPSSHVIVQNSKKEIPESVIEQASKICAKFSVDFGGTYEVDYTQRRNVKIQHGANVLYNPYTTIKIHI